MTVTEPADADQVPPPRFSLLNIHRDRLDLSTLLDGKATPGAVWTAAPQGTVHGLSIELDGQRAEVALDLHTLAITETSSDAAPESLRELARGTYLRYLHTCLTLGAFAFEFIPTENPAGTVKHESLRLASASLGAEWLGQLPTVRRVASRRLPLRSELTVIETPLPQGNVDVHDSRT
ncbi:hypothetical protein IFT90_00660 [Frigoribacterium sp. CFBP 8766]|uniref:hypothetical protein n=1 Tax=Frigoribacterium sp. CFBP 8766 TaxID=2775273 RepID=UPI0017855CFB|nr:hypothetical protein [Frigoribacterium sp. CFBP 8766]MBD8583060.1 hypothetical protein [Frigoribacterium sp. CFBP 8766]